MSMSCPQCGTACEQALGCPTCGIPLHSQASPRSVPLLDSDPNVRWQNTAWGRVAVGVLVTQGLAYCLQLACTSALLAATDEPTRGTWATVFGLVVLQALQALSLLIGGALAGAGQQRGMLLGCLVGILSGLCFVVIQRAGDPVVAATSCGLAVLFGAVGGRLGAAVWKPFPTLQAGAADKAPPRPAPRPAQSLLAGPVSWGRVALGVVVATGGVFWPGLILTFLVDASHGKLRLQSELQAHLITWELAGLLVVLGGAVAGATTRNPFKHGLIVGLGAAVLFCGSRFGVRNAAVEATLLLAGGAFVLTVVGAWFGGQMFPPILPRQRRVSVY